MVPMLMANAAAAAVSMRYGFQGPCENTVHGLRRRHPVDRERLRLIASGRCDAVITGSTEATMTPTCIAGSPT